MTAARLGAALRRVLTPRAVTTCLGVSAITAVPRVARDRAPPAPCPPAAAPIWLWCAGHDVPAAALARGLGDALPLAIAAGLVTVAGDRATALVTLAPLGVGLVVGDRHDAGAADRVPWPDDSTLHLLGCLPAGRRGAWLDVGTGAGALPLAAGPRGGRTRATDLAPRSLARARAGLDLAGRADVEIAAADLLADAGAGWDLISFNAPIPGERAAGVPATGWHQAAVGAALLERFWRAAPAAIAADGEVVVHSAVGAAGDRGAATTLPGGAVTVARYTPPGLPGFAVTRWRPGQPARWVEVEVALGPGHPFVTRADLDAIDLP